MSINSVKYASSYLQEIKNDVFSRIDDKNNGFGNGDGKINAKEVFHDLNIGKLFNGMSQEECNNLLQFAAKIPAALEKYAGEDGEFSEEEYAEFLNGEEWGNVLDAYSSSSACAKTEMGWIDKASYAMNDNMVTKGEIKVGILNGLQKAGANIDTREIENIVDKYAGYDGAFTTEEYMALKNDPTYKKYTEGYRLNIFR